MGTVRGAYCLQTHFISFVHVVVIVPIFNATRHPRHMDAASNGYCPSPSVSLSTLYSTQVMLSKS